MSDDFKNRSSLEWAPENDKNSDDLDLEALKLIDRLLKEQDLGFASNRNIVTDAYFNPGNALGFEQSEAFLKDPNRKSINIISSDTSQITTLQKLLEISRQSPYVLTVTAFSPKSIIGKKMPRLAPLRTLLESSKKFVAVGNLTLDFHFNSSNKKEQIQLFKEQVQLAEEFHKPIYISSVKADKELYQVMDELRDDHVKITTICVPVVRTLELFQMVLDHSCYLLVRPEITHDNENLYRECLKEIPIDRLLLASGEETSAPKSLLGKWNSPEYINETVTYAAAFFGMEEQEFLKQMTINFNKIFNSDPEAGDDEFYFQPTDHDQSFVMTEEKLLENDIDADGDELFITEVIDDQLVGDVYFDKDSRILVYTPKEGFLGADKFKYVVSDGRGGKDSAVVTIFVSSKN